MKKCANCGAELDDGAVVCPNCNSVLGSSDAPKYKLKTNRGLLKYVFFSVITFGIYEIVVMSKLGKEMNLTESKYDGRKTMHYCLIFFIFSWLTLGIVPLIWRSRLSSRIGNALKRRGIDYSFGAGTFWGWGFFGSLIFVGPFIYMHKLLKSMNFLNADYNERG